jgi:hypothetical protein
MLLALTIARRFQGSIPNSRSRDAILEDRSTPGTIRVLSSRKIICAYAQVGKGKPNMYENGGVPDSREDRLE